MRVCDRKSYACTIMFVFLCRFVTFYAVYVEYIRTHIRNGGVDGEREEGNSEPV